MKDDDSEVEGFLNLKPRTAEQVHQYFTDTMISLQESMGVPKGGYPREQPVLIIGGQQFGQSMLRLMPEIAALKIMVVQKERMPDVAKPGIYYAGSEFKLDDLPRQLGETATGLALLEFKFVQETATRNWIRYQLRSKTKKGPKRKFPRRG